MRLMKPHFSSLVLAGYVFFGACTEKPVQPVRSFDNDWRFSLTADSTAIDPAFVDDAWRMLNLPHDWSIEGTFDEKNPVGAGGGALPGGVGWYRKSFITAEAY